QAEIYHLDQFATRRIGQHHILGLEIPMSNTKLMRGRDRGADLLYQLQRVLERESLLLFEQIAQGLALDKFHREISAASPEQAVLVDRHCVWMLDLGDNIGVMVEASLHPFFSQVDFNYL